VTTYGIVVEGPYDEAALPELIKKCLADEIEIIPRPCGGKDQLMKIFPVFLEEFRHAKQGSPVDKALVIRDADVKNPDELLRAMRNKIASRSYPFEVKCIAIVREPETWFLADEEAISKVTQARSGKRVARVTEDLEPILQPKEKLKQILSDAGVPYTREVAREIAEQSDPSKIESRCPKFKEFRQAVTDC
jgi:hypothetical protein